MLLFYQICEVGLVSALIAFVLVIAYLAVTALSIKNTAVRCAKRLYERPLNSAKGIGTAGRAIVVQEKVRVQHIAGSVKIMAGHVKESAGEVAGAAKSIHPSELKSAVNSAKATLSFLTAIKQFAQAVADQRAAQDRR